MTAEPIVSDEVLMAYADEALAPAEAARVADALRADPAAAAKVARFRQTRALVVDAVAPMLDAPVPQRLIAAAQAGPGARRWAGLAWTRAGMAGAALAASFAAGFVLAPQPPQAELIAHADGLAAVGALARALSAQPSGEAVDGVRIAMTVPTEGGGYCRGFQRAKAAQAMEGVACLDGAGWRIVSLQEIAQAAPIDGYRTAAGDLGPATLQALDQRRSGDPLGAEEERAALAAGFAQR
jgi:hypothetical protein